MPDGRIVIITGPPGTGKTTAAAIAAGESGMEKSVHMHTDDFYHSLSKGAIAPHLPESHRQNQVVMEAIVQAAKCYARGGYDTIVDGIVGPWFLDPWVDAAKEGVEIHYIILRATQAETMRRAQARAKLDEKTNRELVGTMWEQFCSLGEYEPFVMDTTEDSGKETAAKIKDAVERKTHLLR